MPYVISMPAASDPPAPRISPRWRGSAPHRFFGMTADREEIALCLEDNMAVSHGFFIGWCEDLAEEGITEERAKLVRAILEADEEKLVQLKLFLG